VAQGLDFTPDAVVVQGRGAPASSLIEYIEQEGAEVTPCQGNDLTSSCSQFSDRVMNGSVRFREQESLRLALDDAVKKYLGGVWVYSARHEMRGLRDVLSMMVEDLWATQPHLRTVIDVRARTIAQLGVQLFEADGEQRGRVRGTEVSTLLGGANPYMTGYDLI